MNLVGTEREPDIGRYAKEVYKRAREARDAVAEAPLTAQVQEQAGSALHDVRGLASDLQHKLARALHAEPRRVQQQELHISVAAPTRAPPRPQQLEGPGIGMLYAVLAVVGGLGAILAVRAASGARARRAQGGRWVRDRSLGGKMVFVEDAPARPMPDRSGDFELAGQRGAVAAAAGAAAASVPDTGSSAPATGRSAPVTAGGAASTDGGEAAMPEWWSPGPRLSVSGAYREQAARRAREILVELEDAKLAGRDYDIGLLVALRQVCGEAGVSVRARTESGRDALFRAGAEAAASAAMDAATSQLGGAAPARFVTGLARDLDVPEEWAATMSLGVVAGRARGALVDACAAYRASDSQEAVYQLLRLAGLLDALPLPPHSAQADMVATGLANRATLPEREAIFMTYGKMEPRTADRVAEMLGFNPELTASWTRPWFCDGKECPPFKNLTRDEDCEVREYKPATFYYVNVTGLPFVAAYAKAEVQLLRYTAGANLKGVKIESTTPALVRFKPNENYDRAEKDYVIAYYLPPSLQDDPPRPESDSIGIIKATRTLTYVASFGGFGVESNIIAQAKALRDKLRADGQRFDESKFWFHLYDPPTKLVNRYNEVAFEAT
ncbi:hypothetical protein WJX81_002827 [Elliptochloris bilobata]|uniref:SOUL heme-binding protein n=1 Tax=Elliptochloris bilobata TaxID=381761 RepID=A0AAW1SHP2_9CHLO